MSKYCRWFHYKEFTLQEADSQRNLNFICCRGLSGSATLAGTQPFFPKGRADTKHQTFFN